VIRENAADKSIYYEPSVSPEQAEEPLHLVEGDGLRKDAYDPVLTEDHEADLPVLEVDHKLCELFLNHQFEDLDVEVESW